MSFDFDVLRGHKKAAELQALIEIIRKDSMRPFPHQVEAVEFFSENTNLSSVPACLEKRREAPDDLFIHLNHAAGLGKTLTCILCVAQLRLQRELRPPPVPFRALISCPIAVEHQWRDEIVKWMKVDEASLCCIQTADDLNKLETLDQYQVIIIRHGLVASFFQSSYEKKRKRKRGRWILTWHRKPDEQLSLLFQTLYDLLIVDEAHEFRNPSNIGCLSHQELSRQCKRRIACTATPICNSPQDGVGMSRCIDSSPVQLQSLDAWCPTRDIRKLSRETARIFRKRVHYRDASVITLPEKKEHEINFHPKFSLSKINAYNKLLCQARTIFAQMKKHNIQTRFSYQAHAEILGCFIKMDKMIISPYLYDKKLEDVLGDEALLAKIIKKGSAYLKILSTLVGKLRGDGHSHIVMVAMHVQILHIAMLYLKEKDESSPFEFVGTYTGADSSDVRSDACKQFLSSASGLLGLSCAAGGVGLNLVPQPSCMIFLQQSYNPKQLEQAKQRIHRIGCTKPVEFYHIVARGSICWAQRQLFDFKNDLADAILRGTCDHAEHPTHSEQGMGTQPEEVEERQPIDDDVSSWKSCERLSEIAVLMDVNGVLDPDLKEGLQDSIDSDSDADQEIVRIEREELAQIPQKVDVKKMQASAQMHNSTRRTNERKDMKSLYDSTDEEGDK